MRIFNLLSYSLLHIKDEKRQHGIILEDSIRRFKKSGKKLRLLCFVLPLSQFPDGST